MREMRELRRVVGDAKAEADQRKPLTILPSIGGVERDALALGWATRCSKAGPHVHRSPTWRVFALVPPEGDLSTPLERSMTGSRSQPTLVSPYARRRTGESWS